MRGIIPLLAVGGLLLVPTPAAATPTTAASTAKTVHKKKLSAASTSRLRIAIDGSPKARVAVKGPQAKFTVTDSSVLKVPAGSYRLRARPVVHQGDSFSPAQRTWRVSVRKGAVAIVSIHYNHVGSASAGTTAPTQSSAIPASSELSSLLALVNEARSQTQQCGTKTMRPVAAVSYDPNLAKAAQLHAQDMADNNYFDHTSLDGRDFVDRVNAANYSGDAGGENIAMGFQTPQAVLAGWLASPGHCTNLMEPDYGDMGLGTASFHDPGYSQPTTYWVQDFGYAAGA